MPRQKIAVALPAVDMADPGANLKRRILLPLVLALMLLAGVFTYGIYRSERGFIQTSTTHDLRSIRSALDRTLEIRGKRLLRALEFLDRDPLLPEMLRSGARARIEAAYREMFERLRQEFDISHFYFYRPDRTVLLRLHQPERFDDRIDRHTLREAERTGAGSVGLELGPIGTLSLRAVKPVYAAGQLVGYVELSEEMQPAIQDVISLADGEGLLILHKAGLSRPDWEDGMRMLGREPQWERLPDSVVTYSTLAQLPPGLLPLLTKGAHPQFRPAGEFGVGGRMFQAGFIPVFDVVGDEVGDLVVLNDVTGTIVYLREMLTNMVAVAAALGVLLIGLFWLILGRVQRALADSRARLIENLGRQQLAEAEIEQLVYYNHLTRLPNRRLLVDRMQRALAVSGRDRRHGAVLFVDLDHFNLLNNTRGIEVGDQLLLAVAPRLQGCVREADTVAHLGGDEFVVLLEALGNARDMAALQAKEIAEKIRAALGKPITFSPGDTNDQYHCTASIGIDLFSGDMVGVDQLLKHADVAMHQAKAAGRDTLHFFDPTMQATLDVRAALGADLRRAVLDEQFVAYFQPQVDRNGTLFGAEVLLRWRHPERGLVAPADFIPIAEETGLIVPIGHWVLESACACLARWREHEATRHLQLAVNVSARQFRQPDFVAQVHSLLDCTNAPAHRLKLELTESLVLDDIDSTIERMHAIKTLGVSFSMDDFGTGYSSLSYLKRLPLDQIKIDRSFVRDIVSDPGDAAIVRTIIAMADSLGLDVIAEGVETTAQLDFLHQHGCSIYQGYLFGRPVPLDEFAVFLERRLPVDATKTGSEAGETALVIDGVVAVRA